MDASHIDLLVLVARLGERLVIVTLVLMICVLLMRVYRDKIQKVDVNLNTGSAKAAFVASFSMPIFLLLVLVFFAFLAFSNPVRYSRTIGQVTAETPKALEDVGTSQGSIKVEFNGFGGSQDEVRNWLTGLAKVGAAVGQLNDIRAMGELEDVGAIQAIESAFFHSTDLARLRLALLDTLHPEGNLRQNCLQYVGPSSSSPSPICKGYVEDFMLGVAK